MDKKPPLIGFKNEVVRVQRQVPDVLRNYPEKQFWRFAEAPFFSASYIKLFAGYMLLMGTSSVIGLWAIQRFNMMSHKLFRGNTKYENELATDFPDLDQRIIFKSTSFSERFKQREKERTEELKKAKQLKEQQMISKIESKSESKSDKIDNESDAKLNVKSESKSAEKIKDSSK